MEHNLFKSKDFEQGKHSVVGDCNGFTMQERWDAETPLFARAIFRQMPIDPFPGYTVLDYGCGVGRIAKEVLKCSPGISIIGIDDSEDQLRLAREYINDSRFSGMRPDDLTQKVDLAYCIYVLQHIPAIELRDAIRRIWNSLKDDGFLVYCSSDYRMAVRFDGKGFFDDRFLGVNIREELERYFEVCEYAFTDQELRDNPVVGAMVNGKDLPHPAFVFRKRPFKASFLPPSPTQGKRSWSSTISDTPRKLILKNRLAPGDILVMTAAIRALHKAHPGRFLTDVDTPCSDIFQNSPYVTKVDQGETIDMHYPEIHKSGQSGRHFTDGHRKFLEEKLGIEIPNAGILPDIFLSQDENLWPSPVLAECNYDKPYWVLNAGSKSDYTLKQYHRYQEFVDEFNYIYPDMKLVQIGRTEPDHKHPALNGVLDMRGKTDDTRKLFRTIWKAEGVITSISFPMHIAAAMEKPCVVVAGGREGTRWEMYPNHRFLNTNGTLDCCQSDGCWKNTIEDCVNPIDHAIPRVSMEQENKYWQKVPLCMELIRPSDILRAVEMFYLGGVLKREVANV